MSDALEKKIRSQKWTSDYKEGVAELKRLSELPASTGSPSDVEVRKLLWLRHGCPINALYGDDGEMQCGICLVDFRRDSVEDIEAKFRRANWKEPVPQLKETFPCVLYFRSRVEADEFLKAVMEAHPNLKSEVMP